MPSNYTIPHQQSIKKNEIDLHELFSTIGRYKKSIFLLTFLITLITAIIAYRMPKYYKTTTVIEVKPKPGENGGFSLGGATALLGLSGLGGASTTTDKDAALLSMYHTSDKVLKQINYYAQYFIYTKYKYLEIDDMNSSIFLTNIRIPNYKNYGMEIKFQPTSTNTFKLYTIAKIFDELLGEYHYGELIHTENFDVIIQKRNKGIIPFKIKLNADQHYIFNTIVSKNLSTEVDKTNPFITVSYLDTLPKRGEAYIKELINNYIRISIGFEIEDADITLNSLQKQIINIEHNVQDNAKKMKHFKTDKKIIAPAAQAEVLIKGQAETTQLLIQNRYQIDLIKRLISFANKNKNIDAIAPSLVEFKDEPTIMLITKLQELQLEASTLAQEFKSIYPKLKSINKQIKTVKKKIKSNLRNLQKTLQSRYKSLKKLLKEYETKLAQAPSTEEEMRTILRTYTLDEKLYAYLLQKRSAAQIKKAEAMSRFRTIEPIYTNPAPAKPKKLLILIVGFITALIFSMFLAFFREFLRKE